MLGSWVGELDFFDNEPELIHIDLGLICGFTLLILLLLVLVNNRLVGLAPGTTDDEVLFVEDCVDSGSVGAVFHL